MKYLKKLWVNQRKLRNCSIICGVMGVLLVVAGCVVPIAINAIIQKQVASQITMTDSNQGMWADIPGDTKAFIVRNFTFFEFKNPFEFLFKQQTPVVQESKVYSYQESAQFVNLEFLDNGEKVKYNFYRHFNNLYDTKNDEQITTLNLGAYGAWNIMKNTNLTNLNLNGLYSLFNSMNTTILPTIINLALSSFIYDIKDMDAVSTQAKQFCTAGGIDPNGSLCLKLWSDPVYGWKENTTRIHWVIAQNNTYPSSNNEKFMLQDYFKLNFYQFNGVLQQFQAICSTYQSVIEAYYSAMELMGLETDSFSLAATQWVQSYVSLHPQGNLSAFDSLTQLNKTLFYMPEIKNYRDTVFLQQYPHLYNEYFNVSLPFDWARKVIYYTDFAQTGTFTKKKYSMLNLGNLEYLWINGLNYDNSSDTQYLKNIANRFEIPEDQSDLSVLGIPKRTFLFWNYIKYFAYNFTMAGAQGGNSGQAAIGQFASNSLQASFQEMKNRMPVKIKASILQKSISSETYNTCLDFFQNGLFYEDQQDLLILTPEQAQVMCDQPQFQNWKDPKTFENIIDYYMAFRDLVGPQLDMVADFEDSTKFSNQISTSIFLRSTINQLVESTENYLFTTFNCQSQEQQFQRCSNMELALKQWSSSEITKNIDETIQDLYKKSDSYFFWANNKNEIYAPFEYFYFAKNVLNLDNTQIQQFTNDELLKLLNYDNLFSLTIIPLAFRMHLNGDSQGIKNQFFFDDSLQLVNYIRYIMMEISLYSAVQTRELKDLLFGYTDPFVYSQNTKDPQQGGNPALNYTVMLNDPNMTSPQATLDYEIMYTGKGNIDNTRQYYSLNGSQYVNYYYTWFDGEEVRDVLASPWEENVLIQGSDSVQNPPNLDQDSKINVFVTTFYRGGSAVTNGETHDHGGLSCYRFQNEQSFYESGQEYPPNNVYDSYVYYGLQNMTRVKMAPVFITNRHLYNSDSRLINTVTMLDVSGNPVTANPESDGLFMDVEPYSGLTLAAALNAQANILVEPDDLFNITQPTLLPVFNTFRTGNWTDASIDNYLGELKMALIAKKAILITCVVVGGLLLIVFFLFLYRYIVLRKLNAGKSLKESVKHDEEQQEIQQQLVSENYI
ncbi:CD36 family protein (macronuclear) [Tetrahymena thermophila SB210]|uniref:CD36 family protein n=1 Tax=Tetrahymena thermophila (strain SB210) TaxID=312017 RepID=I7MIM1_TETTS|nr:CD36 family protein [Tetrahymena thermophila SB210]EAS04570.2 CD36 family protein [Tetrahymena thermophila SB210]|eukprot:XP_001024815.2 CD36 family protein [Tetrahymena thermophila SB210]